MHRSKSHQSGATLIEVVFVISLLAIGSILTLESKSADFYITAAKGTGGQIREYGKAVQRWIDDHPGASGVYNGTKWLKPTTCGGLAPAPGYLDCKFNAADATDAVKPDPIMPGSLTIQTVISTVSNAEKNETMGQTTLSPYLLAGEPRSDLAGIAAMAALSGNAYDRSMFGSINSNPMTAVISITSRKSDSGDAWLRADGSNGMEGSLSFDSANPAYRRIIGASRLQAVPGQPLILGIASGLSIPVGVGVVVDSDTEVLGKLTADAGIDSSKAVVITSGVTKIPQGNLVTKLGLANSTASTYIANPGGQSRFNSLTIDGLATITPDMTVAPAVRPDPVLEINTVAVELSACPTNGEIAKDNNNNLMSCQGNIWLKVGKTPFLHRFVFTSSGTWTVPENVTGGFISAAGGGGSGMGWRIESHGNSGNSGGYVLNHQVVMTPGETLQITIGQGGAGYSPINTGVLSNAGFPYYIYQGNGADSGLVGKSGGTTRVTSPTNGTLLECSGGSGTTGSFQDPLYAVNNGKPAGGVSSLSLVAYPPAAYTWNIPKVTHSAVGSFSGAGVCGPDNYGLGIPGMSTGATIGDTIIGGRTPFGYGSGGDLIVTRCYVSADVQSICRFPQNAANGVVMIDVFY